MLSATCVIAAAIIKQVGKIEGIIIIICKIFIINVTVTSKIKSIQLDLLLEPQNFLDMKL